jgi:1-acyl-sn-glycerol-3-phosphate acyltransferase
MSSVEFSATLVGPGHGTPAAPPRARRRDTDDGRGFDCTVPGAVARACYRLCQFIGRSVAFCTMKVVVVRPELAERDGGYVLACTHMSHLEPFCASGIVRRKIDWMARVEFFRPRLVGALLRAVDAFPVNRVGVPVRAIRTAVARAAAGRAVGIFPEGGVANGAASVCRGGPIKKGACVVSLRAGVPIVPCVILGTYDLNAVGPWLPFRRARLWVAFGPPVEPRHGPTRRQSRDALAADVRREFVSLYAELRTRCGIDDAEVP